MAAAINSRQERVPIDILLLDEDGRPLLVRLCSRPSPKFSISSTPT
jgi:hypothetical protein